MRCFEALSATSALIRRSLLLFLISTKLWTRHVKMQTTLWVRYITVNRSIASGKSSESLRHRTAEPLARRAVQYKDYSGVAMIRVYPHASSKDALRLSPSVGPLTAWRWRGIPVLQWPAEQFVPGWTRTDVTATMVSYSYGHPYYSRFTGGWRRYACLLSTKSAAPRDA